MSKVLTTPKGTAVYPRIDTPDTKFNDDGVYSCKLHVSEEAFNAFTTQVTAIVEREYKAECTAKGKNLKKSASNPIRITPDGDFEIYAKQVAQRQTKKGLLTFSIPVFDSKGSKLPTAPAIGSGSSLKLSVEVYTWYTDLQGFGYTLRLKAVQLLELIEYNNGSGSSYGFTEEENGYINDGESLDTAFQEEDSTPAASINF
jgi:hypothetical protein